MSVWHMVAAAAGRGRPRAAARADRRGEQPDGPGASAARRGGAVRISEVQGKMRVKLSPKAKWTYRTAIKNGWEKNEDTGKWHRKTDAAAFAGGCDNCGYGTLEMIIAEEECSFCGIAADDHEAAHDIFGIESGDC